jgi:hypothetical protein
MGNGVQMPSRHVPLGQLDAVEQPVPEAPLAPTHMSTKQSMASVHAPWFGSSTHPPMAGTQRGTVQLRMSALLQRPWFGVCVTVPFEQASSVQSIPSPTGIGMLLHVFDWHVSIVHMLLSLQCVLFRHCTQVRVLVLQ